DNAVDIPRPAEQARRGGKLAGAEMTADLRRRRDLAADLDRRDDVDLDAGAAAVRAQRVGRAGAAVAVREVIADDDRARAQRVDHELVDERVGREMRELAG